MRQRKRCSDAGPALDLSKPGGATVQLGPSSFQPDLARMQLDPWRVHVFRGRMHARRSTGRYPRLGTPTKSVHACKVFVDASMPGGRGCTSVVHRCNSDLACRCGPCAIATRAVAHASLTLARHGATCMSGTSVGGLSGIRVDPCRQLYDVPVTSASASRVARPYLGPPLAGQRRNSCSAGQADSQRPAGDSNG